MAETDYLTTPEQVYNRFRDAVTQLALASENMARNANVYEQRIGAEYFNKFKAVPEQGEELTEEQEAYNENIDFLAEETLEMVVLYNNLRDNFLTPGNMVQMGQKRNDL